VVERDELAVALEAPVGEAVRPVALEVEAKPLALARGGTVPEDVGERGERARDVVEDPVQHDPQIARVTGVDQTAEVVLVAEPLIDAERVDRVVAVRQRREDRREQDAAAAERAAWSSHGSRRPSRCACGSGANGPGFSRSQPSAPSVWTWYHVRPATQDGGARTVTGSRARSAASRRRRAR
jgi:hypothetical protein